MAETFDRVHTRTQPRYLSVGEAGDYLGTGERFVRRLVAERRIRFYRLGRHVRFAEPDLLAFVEEGRVEASRRIV